MRSRDEFEALVLQKIEAKRSDSVRTRRAWESVAATAAVCFLMVLTAYLVVPNGMGNPAVTVAPDHTAETEITPPEMMDEEYIALRALSDAALAEAYGITDLTSFDVDGGYYREKATFTYCYLFHGYRTDERYTVSLTRDGELLEVTDEEAGLYTEDRIFDRFAKVDVERALASLAEQRRPYAHIENHACEMTVSRNKLQLYVEIIEDIDPPETQIYDGTVFDSGCGMDHRHIMFHETVTAIQTTVPETEPETDRIELSEDLVFEDDVAFHFDNAMSEKDLEKALNRSQCPEEVRPTLVQSLTETELQALLPFFRDPAVREILALDAFYDPGRIDVARLLDGYHGWGELTSEEIALLELMPANNGNPYYGCKLTTDELMTMFDRYLDTKITRLMMTELRKFPYLKEHDAYYHVNVEPRGVTYAVEQGWLTGNGDYFVRFIIKRDRMDNLQNSAVLLSPTENGFVIRQLHHLKSNYPGVAEIFTPSILVQAPGFYSNYGDKTCEDIYEAYLSLPLVRKVRAASDDDVSDVRMKIVRGGNVVEEVWLHGNLIRIGELWFASDPEAFRAFYDLLGIPSEIEPPESQGEEVIFYPDKSLTIENLQSAIQKTGCPAALCPSVKRELNDLELLDLLPLLRDPSLREILSLEPFFAPEQADLGWLLYCQTELAELTDEELGWVGVRDDEGVWFSGSKMTTTEIIDVLETYFAVHLTPYMLQTLWDEPYVPVFDAYYGFHTDYLVAPLTVLQGWETEDGDLLIRFYRDGSVYGDYLARLSVRDDGYAVRQILSLGQANYIRQPEALIGIGYIRGTDDRTEHSLPSEITEETYREYLSLPLLRKVRMAEEDEQPTCRVVWYYKNGAKEEVWLGENAIRIGEVWFELDADAYAAFLERLDVSYVTSDDGYVTPVIP